MVKNTNSPIMSLPSLPDPPLEALVPVSNHSPASLDCSSPSWQALLAMMWESPPAADGAHSLHFLDKMTSRTGLVDSFECGTENQRRQVWTKLQRECTVHDPSQALSGLLELPFHILDPPLAQIAEPDGPSLDWLDDPLSLKTHQLLLLIKDIVRVKPRNSAVTLDWSPGLQNACLQFFSPSNLRKFLGLYWAIWHPNVNFVHRASFDPLTAKPAILATMALIGGSLSDSRISAYIA